VKKILFTLVALSPMILFASSSVETDIFPRTVNFIIFVAILYYIPADKARVFFADRTSGIQSELDKVQELKKESAKKVSDAKEELEKAKQLATEIIEDANADISSIKTQIEESIVQEIAILTKNLDEKLEVETKKIKKEVVSEILDELLSNDNIDVTQDDVANIILSKVA